MKKIIIHIMLIITFIITYLLQTVFFTNFTIAGVMPNLLIILMLYIGLYIGRSVGIIYGIVGGIFIDLWIGKNIGITSICLAIVGFLGGAFDKSFAKDSRITILLMVAFSTLVYEVIMYALQCIIMNINAEVMPFLKILIIEVIYNIIISIIIYPTIKLTGYEIENEVKGDKIMTRYF